MLEGPKCPTPSLESLAGQPDGSTEPCASPGPLRSEAQLGLRLTWYLGQVPALPGMAAVRCDPEEASPPRRIRHPGPDIAQEALTGRGVSSSSVATGPRAGHPGSALWPSHCFKMKGVGRNTLLSSFQQVSLCPGLTGAPHMLTACLGQDPHLTALSRQRQGAWPEGQPCPGRPSRHCARCMGAGMSTGA